MKHLQDTIKESIPSLVVFQHAGHNDAVEVKYLMQSLKDEFGDKANIFSVDSSFNGNVKTHFKLREYPTWILFKEGDELMRESGRKKLSQLEDMLRTAL